MAFPLRRSPGMAAQRLAGYVLLTMVSLGVSVPVAAQVGSGSPDASAQVQRRGAHFPGEMPGQALDQDAAVLATVPADPLFRRDPFHRVMGPVDTRLRELRESERLTFAATYTLVDQYATDTPDGVRHNWATGRFDLVGGWKAYDRGGNAGSFAILVRSGVNLGVSQKFNLSDSLGSGLVLNCLPGGGPQEPITLNILYYRQDF